MDIRQDTTNSYLESPAAPSALVFVALSIATPSFVAAAMSQRVAIGSLTLSSLFQRKVKPS
ncbi:hypothetical protein SAMN04488498_101594 [Mesorhizobium albiziae]|uniref:Uncharacterized protein n=1 Tax=Neomesorhizobium albiziae TaxID=335020 RepID=A0A1I3VNF9_9HYPH|nr:hypothetical protein [Mesorhizobium albiziae]GLS29051.1 hypothetical protein GCM10007937_07580 [Mesorhizobium albiziae]SFJ96700.1 hypothetical protein SAMN04488498_101594 [Mesorhizobium albiziae]